MLMALGKLSAAFWGEEPSVLCALAVDLFFQDLGSWPAGEH